MKEIDNKKERKNAYIYIYIHNYYTLHIFLFHQEI